ncbi:hypothetical protein Pelo_19355 [Pelomyxa schiedti]|nr:hypothetical protein Pelo_19355 [Pelomyxa schiedti]
MVNTFDLASQFRRYSRMKIQLRACKSENLGVVKWCFETFPENPSTLATLVGCLGGKGSDSVKICEYVLPLLKLRQPPGYSELNEINRVDVLEWATSTFSLFTFTEANLSKFCNKEGGLELVKFAVERHSVRPSLSMLCAACKSKKDDVPLAKWLSTKLKLSPDDICDCFAVALASSNTSIASWLDETFGITSKAAFAATILEKVCHEIPRFEERVEGVKLLLACPTVVRTVSESTVVHCIEHLLTKKNVDTAPVLLIEKFHISEPKRSVLLCRILAESIQGDSFSQVKKVASIVNKGSQVADKALPTGT